MGRLRLVLKSVELKDNDGIPEAIVKLGMQDKFYLGICKFPQTADSKPERKLTDDPHGTEIKMRMVVEATLAALAQGLSRPVNFEITSIEIKDMMKSQQKYVMVLLKSDLFIEPVRESIDLFGACELSDSLIESVARATLDATNRAVSSMLTGC